MSYVVVSQNVIGRQAVCVCAWHKCVRAVRVHVSAGQNASGPPPGRPVMCVCAGAPAAGNVRHCPSCGGRQVQMQRGEVSTVPVQQAERETEVCVCAQAMCVCVCVCKQR